MRGGGRSRGRTTPCESHDHLGIRLDEVGVPGRVGVMDHPLDRLTEARAGLIALPVLDIVDRLHLEFIQEHARVDTLGRSGVPHNYAASAWASYPRTPALRSGRSDLAAVVERYRQDAELAYR